MKKPKQSGNEANRTRTYSFRYDDLFEPQNGSLQLLSATVHADIWKLLTDVIVKLCAYEYVEHDKEHQERFYRLVGERVTRQKVQRWLLGTLIYKLQRCLTITLGSHLEADATTGDFASELTGAVRPEEAGQIYREPIEKLSRELVSIANQNRPAILDEVYRRQQIAHDALAIITPFRLSAMLIGLLANGFIAAVSSPAIPKLVEMVERGFLPSLKRNLLTTPSRGGRRKVKVADLEEEVRKALGIRYSELRDSLTKVKQDAKAARKILGEKWRDHILKIYPILKKHRGLLKEIDPHSVPDNPDGRGGKSPWEIAAEIAAREKIPNYRENSVSADTLVKVAILPPKK